MVKAMPLEYLKADGFNRGSFTMTQNDPSNSKIVIFSEFLFPLLFLSILDLDFV